jgi:hypothetical protein
MAGITGDPLLNPTLSDHQHAKNQTLVGIDNESNLIIGDVDTITDDARGGNDVLIGGNGFNVSNTLYGDALSITADHSTEHPSGGTDILIGGSASGDIDIFNIFCGDAPQMFRAQGGNDVLIGANYSGSGSLQNALFGDAVDLFGPRSVGGNDVLTGGNSTGSGVVTNGLVGDAAEAGVSRGGNDTLIAGTQSGGGTVINSMYGDWAVDLSPGFNFPGHDTFVFDGNFGNQTYVNDFHQGEDLIDIVAAHGLGLDALTITQSGSDTLVHLTSDPNDVITLVGFTGTLTQSDFLGLLA